MKIVAIIQARMGSTRLPGKVLKTICGATVLAHVVKRVQSSLLIDEVVIATTDLVADMAIVEAASALGVKAIRGSECDVLSRYYLAAVSVQADVVVRITSDCPLMDGALLTEMLNSFLEKRSSLEAVDYLSNTLRRTYPRGLDVEIFTFDVLKRVQNEALLSFQREHVTPYIYQHPDIFRLESHECEEDHSSHRWTLDTPEDWELISAIYTALYRQGLLFSMQETLDFLRVHPALVALNSHIEQKKS